MVQKPSPKITEYPKVRITDIVRNPALQVRKKIDKGTVARYRAAYSAKIPMPPVSVAREDKPGSPYILTDGWHRIAALEALGRTEVEIDVTHAPKNEMRWIAARANLTHGLPLRSSELRNVFRAYVKSRQHRLGKSGYKSYRVIAEELGGTRSYTTIRNWMMKDFPGIARHMAGEDDTDNGGLIELEADTFEDHARVALQNAFSACRAVADPVGRGRLISLMEEELEEMKGQGEWVPFDPRSEPF